jgi:hypothetical protein
VALELLDYWSENSSEFILQRIRAILRAGLGVQEQDNRSGKRSTPGKLSAAEQQVVAGSARPRNELPEYIRKTLVM